MLDELDREPTLEEFNEALDVLAPGKVPGNVVFLLKCCKERQFFVSVGEQG